MSHLSASQMAVTVPVSNDFSARRSVFKASNINFRDKSWAPVFALDMKAKNCGWRRNQNVICMSVQQASVPKVAVSPLELENPAEPPLNLHKPKEPYTATIVSVERLVGPKAPGGNLSCCDQS
uniref:Uncharacterized protein n=1 Tax=Medicago truncatula TaxID=3880 RepID=B7FJK8_MEDTR|nr:unknown [Medicago truncatula]